MKFLKLILNCLLGFVLISPLIFCGLWFFSYDRDLFSISGLEIEKFRWLSGRGMQCQILTLNSGEFRLVLKDLRVRWKPMDLLQGKIKSLKIKSGLLDGLEFSDQNKPTQTNEQGNTLEIFKTFPLKLEQGIVQSFELKTKPGDRFQLKNLEIRLNQNQIQIPRLEISNTRDESLHLKNFAINRATLASQAQLQSPGFNLKFQTAKHFLQAFVKVDTQVNFSKEQGFLSHGELELELDYKAANSTHIQLKTQGRIHKQHLNLGHLSISAEFDMDKAKPLEFQSQGKLKGKITPESFDLESLSLSNLEVKKPWTIIAKNILVNGVVPYDSSNLGLDIHVGKVRYRDSMASIHGNIHILETSIQATAMLTRTVLVPSQILALANTKAETPPTPATRPLIFTLKSSPEGVNLNNKGLKAWIIPEIQFYQKTQDLSGSIKIPKASVSIAGLSLKLAEPGWIRFYSPSKSVSSPEEKDLATLTEFQNLSYKQQLVKLWGARPQTETGLRGIEVHLNTIISLGVEKLDVQIRGIYPQLSYKIENQDGEAGGKSLEILIDKISSVVKNMPGGSSAQQDTNSSLEETAKESLNILVSSLLSNTLSPIGLELRSLSLGEKRGFGLSQKLGESLEIGLSREEVEGRSHQTQELDMETEGGALFKIQRKLSDREDKAEVNLKLEKKIRF